MRHGNFLDGGPGAGHGLAQGMHYAGYGFELFLVLGVVAIIALLFVIFVHNNKKRNVSASEAEEKLKMRYVSGELTLEEFEKMKKVIQ